MNAADPVGKLSTVQPRRRVWERSAKSAIILLSQQGHAMRLSETEKSALKVQLAELRAQHRELDQVIQQMTGDGAFDQLEIQRLKKQKLKLKDEMLKIESRLLPDIIA
jgi:hypothetical protein